MLALQLHTFPLIPQSLSKDLSMLPHQPCADISQPTLSFCFTITTAIYSQAEVNASISKTRISL